MLHRCLYHLEIFRESGHGLSRVPLGQSREEIRIRDTEMTFDPMIHPGQAKDLNGPRAARAISVAVKRTVQKHLSRLDFHATRKAGFYKGAGQDDARVTLQMTVTWGRDASRKCLEPNLNPSVRMVRVRVLSVKGLRRQFHHRRCPLPLQSVLRVKRAVAIAELSNLRNCHNTILAVGPIESPLPHV